MRKIGSLTPIWNQEMWILPHFDMLSVLDKQVVLLQERPLPQYHIEHGYSQEPDLSEHFLKTHFPDVEIHPSRFPEGLEFGAELYNDGLEYVKDMDIVFRLDPDMFFIDKVWKTLLKYIQETNYNCYHMDFVNDSINYYMTEDFEHGLKDAQEFDVLAWNPKKPLEPVLTCPWRNHHIIKFKGFLCHHFRGWNKPKSTPNPIWGLRPESYELVEQYGNGSKWFETPLEIKSRVSDSLRLLTEMKELGLHETYTSKRSRNKDRQGPSQKKETAQI